MTRSKFTGILRAQVVVGVLGWCIAGSTVGAQTPATNPEGELKLDTNGQEPRQVLIYRFTAGSFTKSEIVNSMTMRTQFKDLVENVSSESKTWKQFRVVSVDEAGGAVLEPLIQRVIMKAKFGDAAPIECDSDQPDAIPTQFAEVAQSVGKPLARVQVRSNGELVKVTRLDGAPKRLGQGLDGADPRFNFLTVLPKEPVGVGAKWRDRLQVPVTLENGLQQSVVLQRTFELTGVTDGIAKISLRTAVITPITDPKLQLQLIQRTPSGTIEFDIARGMLVSQSWQTMKEVVGAIATEGVVTGTTQTVERWLPGDPGVQPAKLQTE
jgi:hypothetical protein